MCGRYAIYGPISRNNREALEFLDRQLEFEPSYNAAPTQQLPVFRIGPRGERELRLMRWGLIPYWAKNAAIGAKMINARADTVPVMPAFRSAFSRRRCLVPMSGFYEWKRSATGKTPYYVHLLNSDIFAAAGLHEYWPGKDGAAAVESFTIITTDANALMRSVHDRMPVILRQSDYDGWLDPENEDVAGLKRLLRPFPAEEMRAYPVSTRVNSAGNNGPELIASDEG